MVGGVILAKSNVSGFSALLPSFINVHWYQGNKGRFVPEVRWPRPYSSIAYVERGALDFTFGGSTLTVYAGEILFTPQDSSYELLYAEDTEHVSMHFTFPSYSRFLAGRHYEIQKLPGDEDIRRRIVRMHDIQFERECWHQYLADFYAVLAAAEPKLVWTPVIRIDDRIRKAAALLEQRCTEKLSTADVARKCGMSTSHFHTMFMKEMGMTPIGYKRQAALRVAQNLLLRDEKLSIEEVAYRCGFASTAYFRRAFREQTHFSPLRFRQEYLEK